MDEPTLVALLFLASYLIGCLNTSKVLTKVLHIGPDDISKVGSRNAGANNFSRVIGAEYAEKYGKKQGIIAGTIAGLVVFVLDAGKGVLVTAIVIKVFDLPEIVALVCGFFCIIGHNWPIIFGFKGGKGIAVMVGFFFLLHPLSASIALAPGLLLWRIRLDGLSPFVAIILYGFVNIMLFGYWRLADTDVWFIVLGIALCAILFLRRLHAEWAEFREAPSKWAALLYLVVFDRATPDPPPINRLVSEQRKHY